MAKKARGCLLGSWYEPKMDTHMWVKGNGHRLLARRVISSIRKHKKSASGIGSARVQLGIDSRMIAYLDTFKFS